MLKYCIAWYMPGDDIEQQFYKANSKLEAMVQFATDRVGAELLPEVDSYTTLEEIQEWLYDNCEMYTTMVEV
jgi:hypothetical protein